MQFLDSVFLFFRSKLYFSMQSLFIVLYFCPSSNTLDRQDSPSEPLISILARLFATNHWMINEAVISTDGTELLVFDARTEMQDRWLNPSVSGHRTLMHSHAISRSLACLAAITRNAHGSQFEFRNVRG